MNQYLLDTNIASHIIRGDIPQVRLRLVTIPMHCIVVSVVTQAELLYGVAKRGHPIGLTTKVNKFLTSVALAPWTPEVAAVYGTLRAASEAEGVSLAPLDMMIAAHALALDSEASRHHGRIILVTRDRAFSRIKSLSTEDWTATPG